MGHCNINTSMSNFESNLNRLFTEGATSKQKENVEFLFVNTLSNINAEETGVSDLIAAITEFNKIFQPRNLGDFHAIINPNTGYIDDKTAKLIYNILDQLRMRLGDQYDNELEKLF